MLTIGLIGGVASGKSTVAGLLAERGAVVIDADKLAHEALEANAVKAELVKRWGESVLSADGQVDRSQLAKRVFGDSREAIAERRFLEGLTHPEVHRRMQQRIAQHASAGGQVAVLDIPLLLDVGWQHECDLLVLVDSPQPVRLARATERGWTPEEFDSREASQVPISEKQAAADAIVKNCGSVAELREQVDRFWRDFVEQQLAGG